MTELTPLARALQAAHLAVSLDKHGIRAVLADDYAQNLADELARPKVTLSQSGLPSEIRPLNRSMQDRFEEVLEFEEMLVEESAEVERDRAEFNGHVRSKTLTARERAMQDFIRACASLPEGSAADLLAFRQKVRGS